MHSKLTGWTRGLVAFLAAVGISSSASGVAVDMPAGSTVWMEGQAFSCFQAGSRDCIGSNLIGVAPPNGIWESTFFLPFYGPATFYAEVLPDRMRIYDASQSTSVLFASFVDTYTVHGSAAGTFPIEVTFSGAGSASSWPWAEEQHRLEGSLLLEIGAWNATSSDEQLRVTPLGTVGLVAFPAAPQQPAPFEVPFSVSATHSVNVGVGDTFELAYGITSSLVWGEIDLRDTGATISFVLPEGVWITSEKGGVFGEPSAPQVPLPPLALGWTAVSLAALGCRSLRRRGSTPAADSPA